MADDATRLGLRSLNMQSQCPVGLPSSRQSAHAKHAQVCARRCPTRSERPCWKHTINKSVPLGVSSSCCRRVVLRVRPHVLHVPRRAIGSIRRGCCMEHTLVGERGVKLGRQHVVRCSQRSTWSGTVAQGGSSRESRSSLLSSSATRS